MTAVEPVQDWRANILLAEDNPADQRLISEALSLHGVPHELRLVENGAEALDVAGKAGQDGGVPCPDLFILDLHLPCVDGAEILRVFRSNPNCSETPVFLFSSTVDPEARRLADTVPGVRFYAKPSDLDQFLALGGVVKSTLLCRRASQAS